MKLEEIENLNKYLESKENFYLDQDTSSKDKIKIFFSLNEDIDENEYQVKINDIENKYRSKGYSIDTVDIYIAFNSPNIIIDINDINLKNIDVYNIIDIASINLT